MLIVFFICCLAVFLTYLGAKGQLKNGLGVAFFVLAAFFSIRYMYGNDYLGYLEFFKETAHFSSFGSFLDSYTSSGVFLLSEVGWGVLNYLFKPLGFPFLVAFLTIFEYYIYYKFIKTYVPKEYQWMAVFTLVLNPQILILQLSMMRQALAIVLLILTTHYLLSEKRFLAILCTVIAISVHKSALIVLPVFIVAFFYKHIGGLRLKKYLPFVLIAIYFILLMSKDYISGLFMLSFDNDVISNYSQYENRMESSEFSIGLGYLFTLIPFILLLRYLWIKRDNSSISLFVFFAAFGYALAPLSYVESLLDRLTFYFSVYTIVAIPFAYYALRDKVFRISLIGIYVLITVYSYYSFMTSPTWVKGFSTYHTLLDII